MLNFNPFTTPDVSHHKLSSINSQTRASHTTLLCKQENRLSYEIATNILSFVSINRSDYKNLSLVCKAFDYILEDFAGKDKQKLLDITEQRFKGFLENYKKFAFIDTLDSDLSEFNNPKKKLVKICQLIENFIQFEGLGSGKEELVGTLIQLPFTSYEAPVNTNLGNQRQDSINPLWNKHVVTWGFGRLPSIPKQMISGMNKENLFVILHVKQTKIDNKNNYEMELINPTHSNHDILLYGRGATHYLKGSWNGSTCLTSQNSFLDSGSLETLMRKKIIQVKWQDENNPSAEDLGFDEDF